MSDRLLPHTLAKLDGYTLTVQNGEPNVAYVFQVPNGESFVMVLLSKVAACLSNRQYMTDREYTDEARIATMHSVLLHVFPSFRDDKDPEKYDWTLSPTIAMHKEKQKIYEHIDAFKNLMAIVHRNNAIKVENIFH